jgi:hypothetical protein
MNKNKHNYGNYHRKSKQFLQVNKIPDLFFLGIVRISLVMSLWYVRQTLTNLCFCTIL